MAADRKTSQSKSNINPVVIQGVKSLIKNGTAAADAGQVATAFSDGTTVAGEVVGSANNGGLLMSTGEVVNTTATPVGTTTLGQTGQAAQASGAGTVIGALAAAKGGYDTYQALQHGGTGLRTGLAETGAGIGGYLGGPIGAGVGAVAGNILGYGLKGDGTKNNLALGTALGAGLTPLVGPFGGALGLGTMLIPGLGDSVRDFLIHKSTKQYEAERWGALKDKGITGIEDAFKANHPDGDAGVYTDGPRKGQKWTFEGALEDAKKDPRVFSLVQGNYKTFGEDWNKYTQEQRDSIVKKLIENNLYKSDHGDIIVTDEKKAQALRDEALKTPTTAAPAAQSLQKGAPVTMMKTPNRVVGSAPAQVASTPQYQTLPATVPQVVTSDSYSKILNNMKRNKKIASQPLSHIYG